MLITWLDVLVTKLMEVYVMRVELKDLIVKEQLINCLPGTYTSTSKRGNQGQFRRLENGQITMSG